MAKNFEMIEVLHFKDLKRVAAENLTILGVPVLEGRAVDNVLRTRLQCLKDQSNGFQDFSFMMLSAF